MTGAVEVSGGCCPEVVYPSHQAGMGKDRQSLEGVLRSAPTCTRGHVFAATPATQAEDLARCIEQLLGNLPRSLAVQIERCGPVRMRQTCTWHSYRRS